MDDAIVVGAGAAGLAGAKKLAAAGCRVRVLEARDRVGGRVYSANFADSDLPAELGAEFVHGAPRELLRIFEERGIPFVDVADGHLVVGKGAPHEADFWGRVQRAAERLASSKKDVPLGEALSKSWLSSETRGLVRSFAEGFHAADVNEIGVHELGEATAGGEGLNGVEAFRLVGPYRSVLEADLPANVGVELLSSVQEIRQLRGAVDIAVRDGDSGKVRRLEARSVLVAVPHAVLAAPADSPAGIRWDPQPACLRAARVAIRTGHVSRLSLRFRSRFWEELGGERPVSFLHAADPLPYPTWWTRAPVRSSVLVAWQGGPCAAELSGRGAPARLAIALRTLASLTGREEKFLRAELVQCLEHDWTSDPFSGGAYTYVACRGSAAAKMFQAGSGEGGVFFAGEATVNGPDRGTVHGAIRSGEIAAAACLAYLSGKARTLRESA